MMLASWHVTTKITMPVAAKKISKTNVQSFDLILQYQ